MLFCLFQAEEITLTIGQAFDLAYRRFLETSGKELELRRQVAALQNKLKVRAASLTKGSINDFDINIDLYSTAAAVVK